MKNRLAELAGQRCKILEKIEVQRLGMTEISRQLRQPAAFFDMGLNAAHLIYRHPSLFAGGLAVILSVWRNGSVGLSCILPYPLGFVLNSISSIFGARKS